MSAGNPAVLESRVLVLGQDQGEDGLVRNAIRKAKATAESCSGLEEFCRKALEGAAAAVLGGGLLDRAAIDHLRRTLRQAPSWSELVVIVLTSSSADLAARPAKSDPLLSLDNVVLLHEPVDADTLVTVLRCAIRNRRRQYELRDLLLEQKSASDRFAAVTEQMESFAHTVSHDLRAPLRAIRGFAQALSEDYSASLDATGREYLQRMEQGAERMDRLIQDLLQYSRLTHATITLAPVDLSAAVEQVRQQLEPEIQDSRATIAVEGHLPSVLAHEPSLVQVLAALLSNGMKFVAPGVKPQIRVWATTNAHKARLWFGDNGIGIDPVHHERIFGVFERLHGADAYPGTGMGLAIVASGMTRMGGRFGLESAPGAGSRFWIELPQA